MLRTGMKGSHAKDGLLCLVCVFSFGCCCQENTFSSPFMVSIGHVNNIHRQQKEHWKKKWLVCNWVEIKSLQKTLQFLKMPTKLYAMYYERRNDEDKCKKAKYEAMSFSSSTIPLILQNKTKQNKTNWVLTQILVWELLLFYIWIFWFSSTSTITLWRLKHPCRVHTSCLGFPCPNSHLYTEESRIDGKNPLL